MPSSVHEALVELVRASPGHALDLFRAVGAIATPGLAGARSAAQRCGATIDAVEPVRSSAARIVDASIPALLANARQCDLAIEFPFRATRRTGPTGIAMILEVQLRKDTAKELAWPLYWAAVRARPGVRGGEVWLIVVTIHRATERWALETLARVIPAAGRYGVAGPSTTPRITDPDAARRDPDATLLSALIHAGADDEDLVPAIVTACSTVSPRRGMLMYDVIASRLGRAACKALENKMQKDYVWKSDFAKRHRAEGEAIGRKAGRKEGRAQGREEGREQGEIIGARKILLDLIKTRRFPLGRVHRQRVATCTSLVRLARWSRRAMTADTVAEIFAVRRSRRRHARADHAGDE